MVYRGNSRGEGDGSIEAMVVVVELLPALDERLTPYAGSAVAIGTQLIVLLLFSLLIMIGLAVWSLRRRANARGGRTATGAPQPEPAVQTTAMLSEDAEAVVRSVLSGLAVLSTDLRVLSANPVFLKLFSMTDRSVVGVPLEGIFPGVNPWRLAAEVLGSDQDIPEISVDTRERGGLRHFQVKLTCLRQHGVLRLLLIVDDVTTRMQMQNEVLAARARYWGILDAASDAIISVDEAQHIVIFNQEAERIFGYRVEEVLGHPLSMLLPARHQGAHSTHVREYATRGVNQRPMSERPVLLGRRKNGDEFPVEITISKLSVEGKWVLTAIVRDVAERVRLESALRENQEVLQDFLETVSDLVQHVGPDGRFVYVNQAWREQLQYAPEEISRLTIWDVIHPEDHAHCQAVFSRLMVGSRSERFEIRLRAKSGRVLIVDGTARSRKEQGRVISRAILHDVTARRQTEDRLRELAYYDPLTGLPNRVLFADRFAQAVALAKRERKDLAVLFIDLDRFKHINDTLGHAVGDQLLKLIAQRLADSVRRSNTVCRFGGDEFGVLLGGTSPQGAGAAAAMMAQRIGEPISLEGRTLTLVPSIGIAVFPSDGEDLDALLKNADTAMYRAKTQGVTFQFYAPAMQREAADRLMRESALRNALEQRRFELWFRPRVSVRTGSLVGVEALVRWRREDGSLAVPGDFVPLAEECGLIVSIWEWVLSSVCAQARAWREAGLPLVKISVNVSSGQFKRDEFVEMVLRVIQGAGLDPRFVELELTEHVLLQDVEATATALKRLSASGISLAIDDFGTGYASVAFLKRFPIQTLKIASELVRGLPDRSDGAAVVESVLAIAGYLRLNVIAGGVERHEQLSWLGARGADAVQGPLIAGALPGDGFARYLTDGWRFGGLRAA